MNPLYIDVSKATRISVNDEVPYSVLQFHARKSTERILDHIDPSAFKGFEFNLGKKFAEKTKKFGIFKRKKFNYGNYLLWDTCNKLYAVSTFFPGEPDSESSVLVLDIEGMSNEREFTEKFINNFI